MAAPVADKIILPLDTGNTGKKVRTQTRVVGADTVHEHYFVKLDRPGEFYRLCQFGAVYTGIAAGSATAGHIYAFRWGSSTHAARITRIRIKRQTIVPATATVEFATALFRLTGYTASHTGGTAATLTSPNCKLDVSSADTRLTDSRITSGTALTAGTHTLDAQPFAADSMDMPATATTTERFASQVLVEYDSEKGRPLILRQNTGFIVRNEITMGAAHTVRPVVEVDWEEVLLADLDL